MLYNPRKRYLDLAPGSFFQILIQRLRYVASSLLRAGRS
jgi:hypothetical protein